MTVPVGSTTERGEQLVIEFAVRDLDSALPIYARLGFVLERRDLGFAALRFDDRRLFLEERRDLPPHVGRSRANVRILVPDVNATWSRVQALGLAVEQPIADRYYGLRDFTVRDPDGNGLRFATALTGDLSPAAS